MVTLQVYAGFHSLSFKYSPLSKRIRISKMLPSVFESKHKCSPDQDPYMIDTAGSGSGTLSRLSIRKSL